MVVCDSILTVVDDSVRSFPVVDGLAHYLVCSELIARAQNEHGKPKKKFGRSPLLRNTVGLDYAHG